MSNRLTFIIAGLFLSAMFAMAVFSIKDDSATMDEVAHLPAGYSYLTQKDMRLNPEHPPLIKDLAAFPLLLIKGINFPSDIKDWKDDVNGQWGFGYYFLYKAGNPVDKMIFWSRVPMVLVLILLGIFIYLWAKELFGERAALLPLLLFSFSPTFLAHGRLVTTDVGAAAGAFITTYYFLKSLKNPSAKNIVLAGISFGLAQLCKFSVLIILTPFFVFLSLVWWRVKSENLIKILKNLILIMIISFLLVGLVYQYHVWNYPPERQARDTKVFLETSPAFVQKLLPDLAKIPIIRGFVHYLTGFFMVLNRATSGNTTYFLGEVSNLGWKNYFPVVYSIKEPLAFHFLTLISLIYAALSVKRPFWQNTFQRTKMWLNSHFPEFSMLAFIGLYWLASLTSTLNIGVRHLLPSFPFAIILVSKALISWLKPPFLKVKYLILVCLILWQVVSVFSIYPHFLAYFNEIIGGPDNGYIYVVDSNLDWGQDLKRLKKWVEEKGIEKIYVDYFGGGEAEYYLKTKYAPWHGDFNSRDFPKGNYLAVSATFLQNGRGLAGPGFGQKTSFYHWLDQYKPVTKIGYSIFVYYIE